LQRHAQLALDAAVADALVVLVEAARHRRQVRLLERHFRRRRHVQQGRGEGDDIRWWRGIVVAHIVGRARMRPCHRCFQHPRDVGDMDAAEDLARLDDAFGAALAHGVERGGARPIDAGEAE